MHRDDTSRFLLYIEPRIADKASEPVDDELTQKLKSAFAKAVSGAANYSQIGKPEHFTEGSGFRGWHRAEDGTNSDNHDYLLPNGLITNSLCVHYVRWYRDVVPATDMAKLSTL